MLVSTPVWCGYCPVKVELRETQHSESTTNAFSYDAPRRAISRALRIVGSRSMEKSSIRTKTMLGREGATGAVWTAGRAATPVVVGLPGTWSGASVGTPQAAASNAVTPSATVAIGARRISLPPWSARPPRTRPWVDSDASDQPVWP